jgi:nucleoside-diphosphate-sugar epimerase
MANIAVCLRWKTKTAFPLSPNANIGKAKEIHADIFYKAFGIDNVRLRYFKIFGPKQNIEGLDAAIRLFLTEVYSGEGLVINSDGTQSRDFTQILIT